MRIWLLFLILAGLASSVTLVCEEKEGSDGKVCCNMEVGSEEIASAFNLNCEPSEGGGLKCQFEANKDGETVVPLVTPNSAKLEACSEDGVCIQSQVETTLKQDPSGVTNKKQDDEREPEPVEAGVRVGKYVYEEPYNRYAKPIERTLRAREHLWKSKPHDISTEYALANAHLDLGISHFTAVTEEDYSPGSHSERSPDSFDLKLAVNAFHVAEKMYTLILKKYYREATTIHQSLGALYLQWGEVYQNSHYFDDEVEEDEGAEFNKLALNQYQKSEKHYRLALGRGKEEESLTTEAVMKDIQTNLAHVSHRIGRCLISSIEGTAVMVENLETMLEETAGPLDDVMPQLKILLHTVPKAQEHFAEALRLYRIALDDEMDFDAQIRIQMNMATTLQDSGTAASYASDLPKAIQFQEEGVAISKEIFPHVGTADKLFLTQYIADSMYGLANHYMQLGQYDKTKSMYEAAMDWYEEHQLDPAMTAGFEVTDESLEAYEKQLSDYHELIRDVTMPDGYPDDGQVMYGPNDAYEADLHAALGSLHLSRDEALMAIEHFNQAIRLYQQDESEENLDRSIADVKVSLAAAYFKDSDFRSSVEAHNEAMDIYKAEVGEGKNPIMAGLAEKLGGNVDLSELALGEGEVLGLEELQNLLAELGNGNDVDLTAIIEKLTKNDEDIDGTNDERNDNKDGIATDNSRAKHREEQSGQKVHEELIDAEIIEKVRKSVLTNATSMQGEL